MSDAAPQRHATGLQNHGVMVVVVGPSGAGKDTLMDFAAARLFRHDRVHFVRRVITRSSDAGGENHDGVTDEEFDRRQLAGEFSVSWQAHGLKYGIPSTVNQRLARGDVVIANGSRSALAHFKAAFPSLKVVNIVARPDILAERLENRGRENRDEILARLQRGSLEVCGDFDVITIDNSGLLEVSGKALADLLEAQIEVSS